MTGTSASTCSGKNSKGLPLDTVKDGFASSPKRNSCLKIEYEILKENHETLKIDYESLQKKVKLAEETYEVMKKLLQSKGEGLEVTNARLVEDCVRERNEKDKYKKMVSERKAKIDELRKRQGELLMARRKRKEDAAKLDNKFVALAERFGVIEANVSFLKSLYDAEVAASGIGEANNLFRTGGNNNVNNDATVISDHNDPPRERSVERRSQEDQCKNQEILTPSAVTNHSPPTSASPSPSSSSSDGYDVVFKLPANWPDWAMPKVPGDNSSKS